ncbi:MAG: hypothetical protein J6I53_02570 [Treponema sp.]|nr:hypothetical protein [Treponema sp.]
MSSKSVIFGLDPKISLREIARSSRAMTGKTSRAMTGETSTAMTHTYWTAHLEFL